MTSSSPRYTQLSTRDGRTRTKLCHLLLLVLAIAFTVYEELHLGRVLFLRHGMWVMVAGSLPNLLAEILLSVAFALLKRASDLAGITRAVLLPLTGLVLYEFAQIWMPGRRFDWMDIVASVVGAVIAWLALASVQQLVHPNDRTTR